MVIFPPSPQPKCYKIEFYRIAWLVRLIQTESKMKKKVHERISSQGKQWYNQQNALLTPIPQCVLAVYSLTALFYRL